MLSVSLHNRIAAHLSLTSVGTSVESLKKLSSILQNYFFLSAFVGLGFCFFFKPTGGLQTPRSDFLLAALRKLFGGDIPGFDCKLQNTWELFLHRRKWSDFQRTFMCWSLRQCEKIVVCSCKLIFSETFPEVVNTEYLESQGATWEVRKELLLCLGVTVLLLCL